MARSDSHLSRVSFVSCEVMTRTSFWTVPLVSQSAQRSACGKTRRSRARHARRANGAWRTVQLRQHVGEVAGQPIIRGDKHREAILGDALEVLRRVDLALVEDVVDAVLEELDDPAGGGNAPSGRKGEAQSAHALDPLSRV